MVSFAGEVPPIPPDEQGTTSGPTPISGMFSYLSSIREERDREAALHPRRLLTSSSSLWGDGGGGVGGGGGGISGGMGGTLSRSWWTKYCLLCTLCGSAATILGAIFLVVATLFRYYTTSTNYFESVPTYLPSILLFIVGLSTIAFSCKRNRNIALLRITACWSLCSAAVSSVITITTSLIHMNRLQTLKECVYNQNPPACSCYSNAILYPMLIDNLDHHSGGGVQHIEHDERGDGGDGSHHGMTTYVFENTPDCEVIHGILYSCLRAVFAISVVSVLLSIFLCMLLYQLIGHERKKAYWSRIRRINSDWSADFIACLARPLPRDRSSVLPLMMTSPTPPALGGRGWGPPPPYEEVASTPQSQLTRPFVRPPLRLVTSHSDNCFTTPSPHPFSPTIALDPGALLQTGRQTHSQGNVAVMVTTAATAATTTSNVLSMSSITSLSIPDTFTGTTNSLSTIEDDEATSSTPPGGLASSLTTCKSLQSDLVWGAGSLESVDGGGGLGGGLEDLDLDKQIRLLDEELAKREAMSGVGVVVGKKNASLPCSPLVGRVVKRLLFPNKKQTSAHNLLSFGNINWVENSGGSRVIKGVDKGEGPCSRIERAGVSLPNTPSRGRKGMMNSSSSMKRGSSCIRNKGSSNNKKLSLDEDRFHLLWDKDNKEIK